MSNDATVRFGYDGRELDAGLRDQEKKLSNHSKKTESIFSRMGSSLGSNIASLLPAIGVGATVAGFKAITGGMDDLLDTSLRLNESAEMIQKVEYASKLLASVDADGLTKSFLRLEKSLSDVENPAANEALKSFGITAEQLTRLPLDEKIFALSDAFKAARASGTGFKDISDLIGKSAGDLIPMLVQTRETIQGLYDNAKIIPDSEVQRLADLNDELDAFGSRVKGVATEASAAVVSNVQSVWKTMQDLLGGKSLKQSVDDDRIQKQESMDKREEARRDREKKRASAAEAIAKMQAANEEKAAAKAKEKQAAAAKELETRRHNVKLLRDEFEMNSLMLQGREREAKLVEERHFMTKRSGELSSAGYGPSEAIAQAADEWKNLLQQQRRAEADKQKAQKAELSNKKDTLSMERKSVDLLEAEAKGQTRKVDKLKEEAYITQRMKELSGLGIGPDEAEGMARRELKAMKEKEKYLETGRAHIGGVKTKRYMGSGLDQFERNQEKEYETTDPARPGYQRGRPRPKYDAFGRDNVPPTSAQRNGRYMGGSKGGTRSYSDVTVASTAASQKSSGLGDKLDESNKHLKDIAEYLV